jgi:hypothetical protein
LGTIEHRVAIDYLQGRPARPVYRGSAHPRDTASNVISELARADERC